MSANRSVQAAQRRRAGPTQADPGIPGRSPQPSINSAQMFANQARPGSGPNMPTGRLAAQQAVAAQKQQQLEQQQSSKSEGIQSVSKMTVPQAITLITLRLGAIETKLMNISNGDILTQSNQNFDTENMALVDKNVIDSITSRLESLEKRTSANGSGPEMNLMKQQFENVKQAVIQTKTITTNLSKDNKDLAQQIINLQTELSETKELLQVLQNLTMEHNQKLMFGINDYIPNELNGELELDVPVEEFVGTNLKELIEQEVNATM